MEKILFAMVGAANDLWWTNPGEHVTTDGNHCGYMCRGMCVPLAATEEAIKIIKELGEDGTADWFTASEIRPPKLGGLWVAHIEVSPDPDAPGDYSIDSCAWRVPTIQELQGLLDQQTYRVARHTKDSPVLSCYNTAWTFSGALL